MHRHYRRTLFFVAVGAVVVLTGCARPSPRPDSTEPAPSTPANARPITDVAWNEVALPAGLGSEATFYDAAAGADGFVIVGDTGAFGFKGVALTSLDGTAWHLSNDEDIKPWGLGKVIATDDGYLAVGGSFSIGESGWSSALMTSPDGEDWTVRRVIEGEIPSVAASGPRIVAVTDGATVLVSDDTGASWNEVDRSTVSFGPGSPSAVAVLGSGRWVAVGTNGPSAVAWVSDDGIRWAPAVIDGADPVPGVVQVRPYDIAVGDSVAVAVGTDDPKVCEDEDLCGHYGAGWSTEDGSRWRRLPKGTALTDWWGMSVWPAGSAGVIAGPGMAQSANGWAWRPLRGPGDSDLIEVLAMNETTMIAGGMNDRDDGPLQALWTGVITRED